ncbi:GNAT family N-acetyltransferase, partial [Desulfatiferula olefinivorans]
MNEKILIFKKFIENEGMNDLYKRIFQFISRCIYQKTNVFIYIKQLEIANREFEVFEKNLCIREVKYDDLEKILKASYQSRNEIIDRFEKHKRCFGVFVRNALVSYMWVTSGKELIQEVGYHFKTPNNCVYIYNIRVNKDYRRKGFLLLMLSYVLNIMCNEGYKYAYSAILSDNVGSKAGHTKVGFVKQYEIKCYRKLFSKKIKVNH